MNIRAIFRPLFSIQSFLEKTYHEGLNRLLTDSKIFEKKLRGKTGEKTGEGGNENPRAGGGEVNWGWGAGGGGGEMAMEESQRQIESND